MNNNTQRKRRKQYQFLRGKMFPFSWKETLLLNIKLYWSFSARREPFFLLSMVRWPGVDGGFIKSRIALSKLCYVTGIRTKYSFFNIFSQLFWAISPVLEPSQTVLNTFLFYRKCKKYYFTIRGSNRSKEKEKCKKKHTFSCFLFFSCQRRNSFPPFMMSLKSWLMSGW